MNKEKCAVRFVTVSGVKYLRAEDVAKFISDCAASEDIDVRDRFNEAAFNLIGSNKKMYCSVCHKQYNEPIVADDGFCSTSCSKAAPVQLQRHTVHNAIQLINKPAEFVEISKDVLKTINELRESVELDPLNLTEENLLEKQKANVKIIVIAYKPNSDDYCRGCHMDSYGSDFLMEKFTNVEDMIAWVKEISSRKMRINEAGYEVTIIVNGTVVIKEDHLEYLNEDQYDDCCVEAIVRNKYLEIV